MACEKICLFQQYNLKVIFEIIRLVFCCFIHLNSHFEPYVPRYIAVYKFRFQSNRAHGRLRDCRITVPSIPAQIRYSQRRLPGCYIQIYGHFWDLRNFKLLPLRPGRENIYNRIFLTEQEKISITIGNDTACRPPCATYFILHLMFKHVGRNGSNQTTT